MGILPQDASADGMEGASPRQVDLAYAHGCTGDAFDTAGHIESGSAGERQQQNPVRINAVDDQVGDPVGQGLGLARTGTGNHQQWPRVEGRPILDAVLDGTPLLLVEIDHVIVGHKCSSGLDRVENSLIRL